MLQYADAYDIEAKNNNKQRYCYDVLNMTTMFLSKVGDMCSSQTGCSIDASTCLSLSGHTIKLACTTASSGYSLSEGLVTACSSQTGCGIDTSTCLSLSGHTTKLACTTANSGYSLSEGLVTGPLS